MYPYDITDILRRKLKKIGKKDKILAQNFYRKLKEIISRDENGINAFKNLRSPMNEYKRFHLTDNFILLFKLHKGKIIFIDIRHRDDVYRN